MRVRSSGLSSAASRRAPIRAASNSGRSRRRRSAPSSRCRGSISRDLRALTAYSARGYHIVAAETSGDATNLYEWRPAWPVCLVFGHEKTGVTESLAAQIETHVRVPMLGEKRSLNVATAGGVLLYELLRRRYTMGRRREELTPLLYLLGEVVHHAGEQPQSWPDFGLKLLQPYGRDPIASQRFRGARHGWAVRGSTENIPEKVNGADISAVAASVNGGAMKPSPLNSRNTPGSN